MSRSPSLVYFEHTPFCIGPVPVPLYLLPIRISLYSQFLYLSFSLRFESPSSPTPNALLWDLDLGTVEAAPYVELRTASPLQPPTLEDVHL
ncbi:hypothetical protein F5051DRAFT_447810 [Lentinula edodes]|nr:hypothetical protein F5051DRAFT_447810 [Lentinula edodes]